MSTRSSNNPVTRIAAIALMTVGAVVMVGAVFADDLELGGGGQGFGWKQLIAAIAGLVLLLIGLAWLLRPGADFGRDDFEE